jgi:hypothetical protein
MLVSGMWFKYKLVANMVRFKWQQRVTFKGACLGCCDHRKQSI